jgi:hypothetical protein
LASRDEEDPEWLGAFEVLEVLAGSLPVSAPDVGAFPEDSIDVAEQFRCDEASECATEIEMSTVDNSLDEITTGSPTHDPAEPGNGEQTGHD